MDNCLDAGQAGAQLLTFSKMIFDQNLESIRTIPDKIELTSDLRCLKIMFRCIWKFLLIRLNQMRSNDPELTNTPTVISTNHSQKN